MKKEYSRKSWFCNLLCIIILLSSTVRISIANEPNSVPFAVNHIAGELKRAFDTRNYKILRKYISKKHKIYWGICYVNGDLFSEFSSFSEFNNKLMRESKDTTIIIKGKPVWIDDLKLWRIKTEGWAGEEPFMDFSLEYEDSQLVLAGICTSAKPDPNAPLPEPALLPRPGPRVFKSIYAFYARIGEILRLGRFDVLSAYAVNPTLNLAQCTDGEGQNVTISEAIDFLKKNNEKNGELKFFYLPSSLESEGWTGNFPFVSFRFTENKGRWEWTGLSICKTRPEEHAKKGKIYYERY